MLGPHSALPTRVTFLALGALEIFRNGPPDGTMARLISTWSAAAGCVFTPLQCAQLERDTVHVAYLETANAMLEGAAVILFALEAAAAGQYALNVSTEAALSADAHRGLMARLEMRMTTDEARALAHSTLISAHPSAGPERVDVANALTVVTSNVTKVHQQIHELSEYLSCAVIGEAGLAPVPLGVPILARLPTPDSSGSEGGRAVGRDGVVVEDSGCESPPRLSSPPVPGV